MINSTVSTTKDGKKFSRRDLVRGGAMLGLASPVLSVGVGGLQAAENMGVFDFRTYAVPAQVPAAEAIVDIGDVGLWYWDTGGTGQPIVLVHPASVSGAAWLYQQPALANAGYRVIGYSRRGFQHSGTGPAAERGTASGDLHRLVEKLGLQQFHLLGVAAGGIYVADYAISHPERVRSLTIACSLIAIGDKTYMGESASLRPQGFESMPAAFRELGPAYRAANPQGTAAWTALAEVAVHSNFRQGTENDMTLASLERIAAPTLLLTGDADLYTPPPMMKKMADRIRGREIGVIDGAGHAAFWEQPEIFNRAVLDFIRKRGS